MHVPFQFDQARREQHYRFRDLFPRTPYEQSDTLVPSSITINSRYDVTIQSNFDSPPHPSLKDVATLSAPIGSALYSLNDPASLSHLRSILSRRIRKLEHSLHQSHQAALPARRQFFLEASTLSKRTVTCFATPTKARVDRLLASFNRLLEFRNSLPSMFPEVVATPTPNPDSPNYRSPAYWSTVYHELLTLVPSLFDRSYLLLFRSHADDHAFLFYRTRPFIINTPEGYVPPIDAPRTPSGTFQFPSPPLYGVVPLSLSPSITSGDSSRQPTFFVPFRLSSHIPLAFRARPATTFQHPHINGTSPGGCNTLCFDETARVSYDRFFVRRSYYDALSLHTTALTFLNPSSTFNSVDVIYSYPRRVRCRHCNDSYLDDQPGATVDALSLATTRGALVTVKTHTPCAVPNTSPHPFVCPIQAPLTPTFGLPCDEQGNPIPFPTHIDPELDYTHRTFTHGTQSVHALLPSLPVRAGSGNVGFACTLNDTSSAPHIPLPPALLRRFIPFYDAARYYRDSPRPTPNYPTLDVPFDQQIYIHSYAYMSDAEAEVLDSPDFNTATLPPELRPWLIHFHVDSNPDPKWSHYFNVIRYRRPARPLSVDDSMLVWHDHFRSLVREEMALRFPTQGVSNVVTA